MNVKTAIITGAAGDIGFAIAERLLADGLRVALLDRDLDALNTRVSGMFGGEVAGQTIMTLSCDVAVEASVQAAIAKVVNAWRRIDILINNAATVTPSAKVLDLELVQWRETLDVNLTGAWLMCRHALPAMRGHGGVILNMSSQLGHVAAPGRGAYGTSKSGLMAFTRALALDYADDGIRAVSLSPGAVLTSRVVNRYGSVEAANAALCGKYPLKRLGTVDEVAQTACFLVSEGAAFITGVDVLADGGYTIQ